MKSAIQKAIKLGGYRPEPHRMRQFIRTSRRTYQYMQTPSASMSYSEILLDPLFWKSLGKAMGWTRETIVSTNGRAEVITSDNEPWFDVWHHFIDHLAADKDAESFFTELLK